MTISTSRISSYSYNKAMGKLSVSTKRTNIFKIYKRKKLIKMIMLVLIKNRMKRIITIILKMKTSK